MIWYDSPSTTILFPWILDARIYSTLKSRTPNKVSRVFFLRQFVLLVKIRRVIPAKQNKGFRVLSFVDQATPRFELGKKDLQSPTLPLGHAAKTLQNRWKYSPFACFVWGGVTKCLFFYCTSIWNLVFLNSLPKRNPSFFLKWIHPFNWFYSISKHTISKSLSFLLKNQIWIFSHKRKNSGQIGTINYWLENSWISISNCVSLMINDVRKSKLIHPYWFFSIKKDFLIITAIMSICKPQNISSYTTILSGILSVYDAYL